MSMSEGISSGISSRLRTAASEALAVLARGDMAQAESIWAGARSSAQEYGLGAETDHTREGARPLRTPWGSASYSIAIQRGVTFIFAERGRCWRLSMSEAARLPASVRALHGKRGSGYVWWDERGGLAILREHPEWGMLADMTVDGVAQAQKNAPEVDSDEDDADSE